MLVVNEIEFEYDRMNPGTGFDVAPVGRNALPVPEDSSRRARCWLEILINRRKTNVVAADRPIILGLVGR